MSDYYTVEFRIYGKYLNPDQISARVGISPTTTQKRGSYACSDKTFEESMWGFGEISKGGIKEWLNLEEGIISLLDVLSAFHAQIEEIKQENILVLWCGHFHDTFGAGGFAIF